MVTFGVEEEFLLVDPESGMPSARAAELAESLALVPGFSGATELLACQLETSTEICESLEQASDALARARKALSDAASAAGLGVMMTGAAPRIPDTPAQISDTARYLLMGETTGAVAGEHYLNGMHIHVAVPDREKGVAALNYLRPWLAVVAALASNSPFWRGQDTGFASWRLIHYRRWSVQGCPPHFAGAADYDRRLEQLLATDVVLDAGHVGWAARLSHHFPTVEVRISDAQLEVRDTVLLAALIRGLVTTALAREALPVQSPELLDAGIWQAARYGLGGQLLDVQGGSASAQDQVDALLALIRPALEEAGDLAFVTAGVRRLAIEGTGAARQRAAAADGGWNGLADIFRRSLTAV
ncbi:glutamate--cysteine ligase [Arthrobacter sp. zg-Y916]|uniref:carboxylate-amine ligase n=1 Tax=Arthrobacter sp. zg-Y916 TaxID=2894190 RepID=UPI001E3603CC|nr:glutamate--cysteine ligase [Arthrobacter sp. zg-Y916]MCC9192911.1 glutamate--cysteine ligase [Arthrobacter sp. zg-Y916]